MSHLNFKKNYKYFREIEHTADVGLEISGDTLPLLFANAAFGFYHLLFETMEVPAVCVKEIVLQEQTLNDLFVSWLSELNYLLSVNQFVMSEIKVLSVQKSDEIYIFFAELAGNQDISYLREAKIEIKAVTYHQLKIEQSQSGFHTRIFFDI